MRLATVDDADLSVVIGDLPQPGGCYPPLMQAADFRRGDSQGRYCSQRNAPKSVFFILSVSGHAGIPIGICRTLCDLIVHVKTPSTKTLKTIS